MTVDSSGETLSGFDTSDDLDAFSKDFFNKTSTVKEEEPAEEPDVEEEDLDTDEPDDTSETDVDEPGELDEDEDEDPEPEEKPKKKSASDRIKELTAKNYETERAANARIKALEDKLTELAEKQTPAKEVPFTLPDGAPDPLATKEDGTLVYELGEFDPKYITALTRFTIQQESKAAADYRAKADREAAISAARAEQSAKWTEKLSASEAEIPDIKDKIRSLDSIVADVPQDVGQYYVDVIMSLENGPHVLAYLADNPNKAKEIVSSGVAAATVSLGRLDARMAKPKQEQKVTTKAPRPATNVPRGTSGRFVPRGDTDDLDEFEKAFFKK